MISSGNCAEVRMFLLLVTDGTRALQNTLVRWGQIVEAAEHGARGRQPPGLPLEEGVSGPPLPLPGPPCHTGAGLGDPAGGSRTR